MRRWMMLAAVTAACGGSGHSGAPIPVEDFDMRTREATCEFQVRCGGAADMAACLAVLPRSVPLSATFFAGLNSGGIHYDAAFARECVDGLAMRSCDITSASYRGYPAACLAAVRGTLHDGDACADNGECLSQDCEIRDCQGACCTGTCAGGNDPPTLAGVGASCATNICVAEAFCDIGSNTCKAVKHLGEACDREAFSCADGLYCLRASSTCGPLPGLGEPCTEGCRDRGAHCSDATGTCVRKGLAGDTCANSADCSPLYPCGPDHTCSAGLALGASCPPFSHCAGVDAFCDIDGAATTGVCTAPRPNGGPCRLDRECASFVCDTVSKTCVPSVVCD